MVKKTYTIGRAGDVTLNDETVSRRHACLEVDGDKLYLRDLDSRNGTYEVRDNDLAPFVEGPVSRNQVFAFGECVRSVAQLLKTAELRAALAGSAAKAGGTDAVNPFDVTRSGSVIAPRKRLTSTDITGMLDRAEDELADGRRLTDICMELGITVQRYERWCREYGATRREREESLVMLRRENARLRKRLAELTGAGDQGDDDLPPAAGNDGAGSDPSLCDSRDT